MSPTSYRFGNFLLDTRSYRLSREGTPLDQPPKVLDLLVLLLSRPGELVTKDQILRVLWPDVAVTDNAITQVVSAAREALSDDPATPTFIQTVPRKGYRFIANVFAEELGQATDRSARPSGTTGTPPLRRVAVADFVNIADDRDTEWLGVGIAETISDALRRLPGVRTVDRTALSTEVRRADLTAAARASVDLLITGHFQRVGSQLRIAGRAVDLETRSATAHAMADGALSNVFALQDAVVAQLLHGLQGSSEAEEPVRARTRETWSLEAYQALTEGRIKLDSLDHAAVPAAIEDFTRAITIDPDYALAYAGLGHAHYWLHQRTRLASRTDYHHLNLAVDYVRKAIRVNPELAEAQAALALFLANTGDPTEAILAGRTAVALEPHEWRHHFRLGIASWGTERLGCLQKVHRLYPGFAFAYFASAMVHVARGDFDEASATLASGLAARPSERVGAFRFPANGLHWLSGLIALARQHGSAARHAFECELAERGSELYADEYAVNAYNALGQMDLQEGNLDAARQSFERGLVVAPRHARALIGLAETHKQAGHTAEADEAFHEARQAIADLQDSHRPVDAQMALAQWQMATGRPEDAIATLDGMLAQAPPGHAGWTVPIEPWLADVRGSAAFAPVLQQLTRRAT